MYHWLEGIDFKKCKGKWEEKLIECGPYFNKYIEGEWNE